MSFKTPSFGLSDGGTGDLATGGFVAGGAVGLAEFAVPPLPGRFGDSGLGLVPDVTTLGLSPTLGVATCRSGFCGGSSDESDSDSALDFFVVGFLAGSLPAKSESSPSGSDCSGIVGTSIGRFLATVSLGIVPSESPREPPGCGVTSVNPGRFQPNRSHQEWPQQQIRHAQHQDRGDPFRLQRRAIRSCGFSGIHTDLDGTRSDGSDKQCTTS